MAKDYTNIADTAARLVEKYGKSMLAVKYDKTAADISKPWEGAEDPRDDAVETNINAVVVTVSSGVKLGITTVDSELAKQSDQMLIVALGSETQIDLSSYNEIKESDITWRITNVEKLQPSSMVLLFFVGIKR